MWKADIFQYSLVHILWILCFNIKNILIIPVIIYIIYIDDYYSYDYYFWKINYFDLYL